MNPLVLILAVSVFLFCLYKFIIGKPTANYPPGPIRLPIVGSYLQLLWESYSQVTHLTFYKWTKKYKSPVIGFYLSDFTFVIANDESSCREIFTNPDLQGRVDAFPFRTRALGEKAGIFDDDGSEWLHMRRFSLREMRDLGFGRRSETYESILQEEVQGLVDAVRKNCEAGTSSSVPQVFYPCFFNCISYLISGTRIPESQHQVLRDLGNVGERFLLSTDSTGRLLALYPKLRYLFPDRMGYNELKGTSKVFEEKIKKSFALHKDTYDPETIRDMMDIYVKNKEVFSHFTETQILVSCIDFTFPNTAVAISLTWLLVYMILYPEVQRKCQEQIDQVVGSGRLPGLQDRQYLPYVEASLREVMRRQTLVPLGFPHRSTQDVVLGGYHIPKDSVVITNMWAMHMDEKVWGDPENFRPERFLDAYGNIKKKDFSLPFGLGKRVCAGETFARQNLFVAFASVLQNFTVTEDSKIDLSKARTALIVTVQENLKMRFASR